MFLEKRVYQGSSGRVYPLPFTDRIAETPVDRKWQAIWLENEFLKVLVLPEIGGRIHAIQDKTNGTDLIYNQPVIKPALVGLAGPWISGGIEFNWPQHHRPATFLPVDTEIESHADGSVTVWCSDHDPMQRLKGMHGVCLHPGRAVLELKVRTFNRTPFPQTFLWWANVATRVHEAYQSFFPPDVRSVADHAKRAISAYPLCQGHYYGVDYAERGGKGVPVAEVPRQCVPPHCRDAAARRRPPAAIPAYAPNDLSFYANIPVPTSYMCMGSRGDFFGGYDFATQSGLVHVANHHISPGKKQWTWGNHEFGYAWDRNLTDADARGECPPYIELMAGVYTDNQPDFSFLQPGEMKSWSQHWYPIQQIGPVQHANLDAAVSLRVFPRGGKRTATFASNKTPPPSRSAGAVRDVLRCGAVVTKPMRGARIILTGARKSLLTRQLDLAPGKPWITELKLPRGTRETDLLLRILDGEGHELIAYSPPPPNHATVPPPATEPPPPADIASVDELYITGLHLEQYRHATRSPVAYWREGLRRDALDSRCNNALGAWHLRRGEFTIAESHFRKAIERLTRRNPNPADGEPYYNLGLCLRYQGRADEAYDALYKATWNQAWAGAAFHALAEIDCGSGRFPMAEEHLHRALRLNADNHRAANLLVLVLRKLGREPVAADRLRHTLAADPLDWWARHLNGETPACDLQTSLDVAHDYARAGCLAEAVQLLSEAARRTARRSPTGTLPDQSWGAGPLVHYYDRRRHREAMALWERSARLDPKFSIVWRNLGIGCFNVLHQPRKACVAYDRAIRTNPGDARLVYERDQLWKRLGAKPERRLRELEQRMGLVRLRDDLSVELCALYNQTGQHQKALALVSSRHFQPWEGGEGGPLGQWVRSHLALGREALHRGVAADVRPRKSTTRVPATTVGGEAQKRQIETAVEHFEAALTAPRNLGEAKHLLANQSDIHYWLGCALEALGETAMARQHWRRAATFKGDFQEMSVRAFSEMTYYSALSWQRLGRKATGVRLLRDLRAHADVLATSEARIDYFATSLPTLLLFDDDLQFRQETTALFLRAQALLGLGRKAQAQRILKTVLRRDPNHALAADLLNG